ncbi:dephospho-CoA kinase domain-containing protein-like [Anneissia japonica]|uniref:dephospho-CoA kinase domain-containing protein-like n=1 Tax=Anneissia japonica TaxID=1529436 RepID=UPI00142559FA|nr:dephospho-CoA kinase domain-containing protein-like [Anneissia japonica]XP_033127341.1 dephospho-CoA kinase domain-containing protein-like [Anneissia japonica]XP_033127350.1 dephospho-CoA kinase domain-containing protein-like [Anneissia japonica]
MFLVGLTGGIASGKSTVSIMLREIGCQFIDADVVARQVVEQHKPAWTLIVKHFGQDMLLSDGNLDRPKLASCIFGDENRRKLLNSCTHPYIQKEIMWQIFVHFIKGYKFVVLDIPLLLEGSKLLRYINSVVVVYCDGEAQLQRLMQRNSLPEEDALKRINSQMPLEKKKEFADYLIENSHGIEETRQQVRHLVIRLQQSKAHLWLRIPFLLLLLGFIFIILLGVKKLCL